MFVLLQSQWRFLLDVIADGTQPPDRSEAVEVIESRLNVNLAPTPKANIRDFFFFFFLASEQTQGKKKLSWKHLLLRPIKPHDRLSLIDGPCLSLSSGLSGGM